MALGKLSKAKATKLKKIINTLVKMGKEQGFLTQEDILTQFPQVENHLDMLDEIFIALEAHDIEVLEDFDETQAVEEEELTLEKKIQILKSIQSNITTDAIRSYLQEI